MNPKDIKKTLSEAGRYIKLTRAMIMYRVLSTMRDLDDHVRSKMQKDLSIIRNDLNMSEDELFEAIEALEAKHRGEVVEEQKFLPTKKYGHLTLIG